MIFSLIWLNEADSIEHEWPFKHLRDQLCCLIFFLYFIFISVQMFLVDFSMNSEFTSNTHSWPWWFISALYSKQNIIKTYNFLHFLNDFLFSKFVLKYNYCNWKQKLHYWKTYPTCIIFHKVRWHHMISCAADYMFPLKPLATWKP